MQNNLLIVKRRAFPNALLYWGLFIMLFIGWILQVIIPGVATKIFELIFPILSLSIFLRKSTHTKEVFISGIIILGYVIISFLYAVLYHGAHILDFIMAYKFTWYILLLLPYSNIRIIDANSLSKLYRSFLIFFLIVYVIKFLGGEDRPTFFIENNFEILFLCFLFYAHHIIYQSTKMIDMFLLLAITIISGSRSGVMLALITVLFSTDLKQIIRSKNIFLPIAGFIGAIGAFYVFNKRTTNGIESIDRYRFYQIFLDSIADWSWWQYLTGAQRITKLPDIACAQLSFYKKLLSFDDDGSCYSVIFHSFNMRIIFDHGLIVVGFLIFFIFRILKNRTFKEKTLVLILLFLNGMSVSSINSVYAALGLAILASIPQKKLTRL